MGGVKKHGMGYVRQIDVCGGRAELRTSPSNLASSTYTICASASVTRNAPSGMDPCGFLLVCTPDAGILAGATEPRIRKLEYDTFPVLLLQLGLERRCGL